MDGKKKTPRNVKNSSVRKNTTVRKKRAMSGRTHGGARRGAGARPIKSVDAFLETPDGKAILEEYAPQILLNVVMWATGKHPTTGERADVPMDIQFKSARLLLNKVYPDVSKQEVKMDASKELLETQNAMLISLIAAFSGRGDGV